MKKIFIIISFTVSIVCFSFSFKNTNKYKGLYSTYVSDFNNEQFILINKIENSNLSSEKDLIALKQQIEFARLKLKSIDFWLRYLEPTAYKKINGPMPVEWETEVFEKFEKPYKREGAGLSLAELYLDEKSIDKDSLVHLIQSSVQALKTFEADSITTQLNDYSTFFLANRLFLLNLSAIYTTGFECPDTSNIIPELRSMLIGIKSIYENYNESFPDKPLSKDYTDLYDNTISFVNNQSVAYTCFDHFSFIKDYVNPLFTINQKFINAYSVMSKNFNDYTLNNDCNSIFDKSLYNAQNIKGIYSLVEDENVLSEIKQIGKLLFYDPILSGNNKRSCASCHKPTEYFTDTSLQTAIHFDKQQYLPRNTPSLLDVTFNHLIMLDGRHISLQAQAKDVITNPKEMNSDEKEVVKKVLSCKEYKDAFKTFLKLTPEENEITLSHIVSAITFYYGNFSDFYSPFDNAMNNNKSVSDTCRKGFNLFMSKSRCATCHFVPGFNGIKPPYIESEFEVLGVPGNTTYKGLSNDSGRYAVNPSSEMLHAFRTESLRNVQYTKPYMHNGVFNTLNDVLDFYDAGGGVGKKLDVSNQTLSTDSLKLTYIEKDELLAFIQSLNENINFENPPQQLPLSSNKSLNVRKVGGEY
jgi:cytochrome c peroxidase